MQAQDAAPSGTLQPPPEKNKPVHSVQPNKQPVQPKPKATKERALTLAIQ
jgi:hypothetical protein